MGATQFDARRRALTTLIGLLAATSLLLAACGSDDDASADMPTFDEARDAVDGAPSPGGFGGGGGEMSDLDLDGGSPQTTVPDERPPSSDGTSGAQPAALTATDLGRSLVYVSTVTIEVRNVLEATRQTQQTMAGLGGVLFGQDTTTSPRPRTVLVFKVQPDDFPEALARLEAIGRVVSLDASADDVTDRVVDLRSRIRSAEVSVERLRELLDAARTLEDIAALERQLLERESNLELLRGQLRTVEDQVALATITVILTEEASEPAAEVLVTAYDGDDEGERCPGERRLEIDEGEQAVLCVTVVNSGNVALTQIEVRDPSLDLRREDFTVMGFGADDQLAPGESVTAWAHFEAGPRTMPRPNVSSVPVDDRGHPLRTAMSVTSEPIELVVLADDSLPGFGDALGTGWGAIERGLSVALVLLGLLLPIAIIGAPVAALWLWLRRRDLSLPAEDDQATVTPHL
jgi:hypothetical protein